MILLVILISVYLAYSFSHFLWQYLDHSRYNWSDSLKLRWSLVDVVLAMTCVRAMNISCHAISIEFELSYIIPTGWMHFVNCVWPITSCKGGIGNTFNTERDEFIILCCKNDVVRHIVKLWFRISYFCWETSFSLNIIPECSMLLWGCITPRPSLDDSSQDAHITSEDVDYTHFN